MIRVVIGAADQSIAYDLRAALGEMDGVDATFVVETTDELMPAVLRLDPDVVLVHDQLGPEPAMSLIRELALRRPSCAAMVVTLGASPEQLAAAMDAGARGVVSYPPTFEEFRDRIAAAGEWAAQMRRLMAAPSADATGPAGRGRVVTLVGAKGGVGTTTVATHLAMDVVRSVSGYRVCLVDLDLEKGDVSGILEVRHRASVADVAKVSQDLSAQATTDAVVVHASGLHLLLTPTDVREVESVDQRSLREVVSVLRGQYDLVLIDAGSHVTPTQAAVVELADEVVALTTPDVLSIRALRRSITQWENLGVRKETDVRVLVNRLSRQATVSAETVRQLTRAPVIGTGLPAMFRRLEPALNARDPFAVRDEAWWRALRAIGQEIGLVSRPAAVPGVATAEPIPARRRGRWGRDTGATTIETVGMLPMTFLVTVLAWQLALYGIGLVWSGHAANAAVRAMSVHQDASAAAHDAVPASISDDLAVSTGSASVTVRIRVPLIAPGVAHLPVSITTTRSVVMEP